MRGLREIREEMKNKQSTEEEGSDVNLERRTKGSLYTEHAKCQVILMLLKQSRN